MTHSEKYSASATDQKTSWKSTKAKMKAIWPWIKKLECIYNKLQKEHLKGQCHEFEFKFFS
jgi:hypothetical protein